MSFRAVFSASPRTASAAHIRLKKPQRSPSSALIERPLNSNSEARPWPISLGSMAQAPMSQPARPTRVNRNAVLVSGVP